MKQRIEYDDSQIEELEKTLPEEDRWENLTIQNSFLFAKVMKDEELCGELLRRIFPDMGIGRVRVVDAEKTMETGWDSRGVRLDVYAESGEKIFDAEMQAQKTPVLPKRSRFYHGTIDVTNLEKGMDYDKLKDTFVIFICPFDVFGQGKHRYTFRSLCVEDPKVELGDGAVTVFLNAASVEEDVPAGIKGFLDYVMGREQSGIEDEFVSRLEEEIRKARRNREWRREYMMGSIYERDAYLRGESKGLEKGLEKGRAEGEKKGRVEGEKKGLMAGMEIMKKALQKMGIPKEEIDRIIAENYPPEAPLAANEELAEYVLPGRD